MAKVVAFAPSPLTRFLGSWIRDPISVSRAKVAKRLLGEEGLDRLWACKSIEELRECLAADPPLAEAYGQCGSLSAGHLTIERTQLAFVEEGSASLASETTGYPILSSEQEGRSVAVRTSSRTGQVTFVLGMRHEWLIVSQRHHGAQARMFPRSPSFRYYRG